MAEGGGIHVYSCGTVPSEVTQRRELTFAKLTRPDKSVVYHLYMPDASYIPSLSRMTWMAPQMLGPNLGVIVVSTPVGGKLQDLPYMNDMEREEANAIMRQEEMGPGPEPMSPDEWKAAMIMQTVKENVL